MGVHISELHQEHVNASVLPLGVQLGHKNTMINGFAHCKKGYQKYEF